ncbi:dentin sialophosphoprotein-like [Oppia nitens]|uniref:dentin sialophosphoprotein-like n=1 Tax=Oppia nitens TaxID=1686743 RepID=UPI0023DC1D3E|nr:dentin sialophosphoprotein-like [Oppia nitens]
MNSIINSESMVAADADNGHRDNCSPPSPPSVPIGFRAFASCSQGGRKYMEDCYDIKYQFNSQNELQYVYLAIFDGHGGDVAAKYAKQHLCHNIIRQRDFWSESDDQILKAIQKGFIQTHYDMRKEVLNWPKTGSGLPSTSGTTASIVFIMNGKYYTGHVGDSRIVLGRKHEASGKWMSCSLTRDHKPESPRERRRIEAAGGQVMNKSGVDRVVWNRPKLGHKGPIRRSTSFDQIPFLAVARSLGDLWSFNSELNTFIVSPEPDVKCIPIDGNDMCLVLASDGLWNMMNTQTAVKVIQEVEEDQYSPELLEAIFDVGTTRLSPSRALVHFCLNRWYQSRFRADNTTVLAVMIEDNQGVSLNKNDQNMPMMSLFTDSEDEESDDGYDDTLEEIYNNYNNQKTENNENLSINKCNEKSTELLTNILTTTDKDTSTDTTVPSMTSTSSKSTELSPDLSNCPKTNINGTQTTDLTPFTNTTNTKPNIESFSSDLSTDSSSLPTNDTTTTTTTTTSMCESTNIVDDTDGQSSESSRDSGTSSPPTPTMIAGVCDELTDEEYAALPSLVNLSQNEWELYVVIDPKNLSVDDNSPYDLNNVSAISDENSCLVETQSSLANINKVIGDNTPLNQYLINKTGLTTPHYSSQQTMNNSNSFDNNNTSSKYWPNASNYIQMTSLKPRTSLPLSYADNHLQTSSPMISNGRNSNSSSSSSTYSSLMISPNIDRNLCIFGAINGTDDTNDTENSFQKLSKLFSQSNNISQEIKIDNKLCAKKNTNIFRHRRLLRRLTIDNNSSTKLRSQSASRSSLKRKRCSSDYSPPSKHLRSSLWTRPVVSKEQIMKMSFTRSLKQLAVGRLTRSRLRPMKMLKTCSAKK